MWLSLAWAVLALCALGACTVDRIGPAQDPKHPLASPIIFFAAFTLLQGFFLPLLPALTLLLTTAQLPGPPAVLARLLSHAVCARLASTSYEMYLVHSLVRPYPLHRWVVSSCICCFAHNVLWPLPRADTFVCM